MAPGQESALTYSRDEMVRLQSCVAKILIQIRTAEFDPDLPKVEIGFNVEEDQIPAEGQEEVEPLSESDEEEVAVSELLPTPGPRNVLAEAQRDPAWVTLLVHWQS